MEGTSIEIRSEEASGQARLSLVGEVDLASAPKFQHSAEKLLDGAPRLLVIDLSRLSFIDSSGLRVMMVLHERSQREGWELQVVAPAEHVLKIFQISGIDQHLKFIQGGEGAESS